MKEDVERLLSVIAKIRAVGLDPAPAPGVSFQHVMTGLGYLVALQRTPEAASALAAGMDPAVLASLQSVIEQWLSQQAKSTRTSAGFYDQASEHLRRLGGRRQAPPASAPSTE